MKLRINKEGNYVLELEGTENQRLILTIAEGVRAYKTRIDEIPNICVSALAFQTQLSIALIGLNYLGRQSFPEDKPAVASLEDALKSMAEKPDLYGLDEKIVAYIKSKRPEDFR